MKRLCQRLITLVVAGVSLSVYADEARPDQLAFRALYKELVETNTALSAGSCTLAAERMAAHLRAAGYPDNDIILFTTPEHPKEGGLVARLPGSDPTAKAILLLAHLDVVEAKREDWVRDPFTLIEEDGKFYGRGTSDDKAQASIWVDSLVRFRQTGFKPKRTIKMALTCGEEGAPFNGAAWLAANHRDWIDAAFAINEGGGGSLDAAGKPVSIALEAAEKTYQDYRLEVTNPGGHSSRPVKDNAIYRLAHALLQVEGHGFKIQLIDASRAYFAGTAEELRKKGETAKADAIAAMLANPTDSVAAEKVAALDPGWNGTLRTTCVATMLDGGHAPNALPQRAGANVNCRIFPGVSPEQVGAELASAINDPGVVISMKKSEGRVGPAPSLTPQILGPVTRLMNETWPGVPVLPVLQAGATDGRYLNGVGIPTFGIDGSFLDQNLNHIHGLNEYADVAGLYRDRDFLYRLIKVYADEDADHNADHKGTK